MVSEPNQAALSSLILSRKRPVLRPKSLVECQPTKEQAIIDMVKTDNLSSRFTEIPDWPINRTAGYVTPGGFSEVRIFNRLGKAVLRLKLFFLQ